MTRCAITILVLILATLASSARAQVVIGNGGQVNLNVSSGGIGTIGTGYAIGGSGLLTYSPTIPWVNVSGAPTAYPPNGSASGDLCGTFPAPSICKINGSQSLTGTQGSTGAKVFVCTGSFTPGNFITVDANGNCHDGGGAPGGTLSSGNGVSVASGLVTNLGNTDLNLVTSPTYHLDNTGSVDITTALSTFFNSGNDLVGYLPCGTYKQLSPITINATASTGKNIKIYPASPDCVTINLAAGASGSTAWGDAWWFNNTATSADNNYGPTIGAFIFNDISGTCAVHSAIRITQYANVGAQDWKATNLCGIQYQTGTVSVTNNSTSATISGGTCPGASSAGDVLWVGGHYQEIASCSGTSVAFTIPWQYATNASAAYSLDRNGEGLILDGGSSYVQYNKGWLNIRAVGVRVGVHALGTSVSTTGVSRFDFGPSFINCNRVNDSMAFLLGDDSDTFTITTKANNCSRFVHAENSHNFVVDLAKFENDGTGTTAFGCTASPNIWSCNVFVEAIGNNASLNARGNKVVNSYAYLVGVGITWDQYDKNFYIAGNDLEGFAVDSPIVPPAFSSSGFLTAEVHDPSLQLLPGGVTTTTYTVSTLPTPCNSTTKGARANVSDATTPTYLGTLTGGGTVFVSVQCNGTAWVSH